VIEKGNTAIVAEMIAEETGADLFEVMPEDDHYPMTYDALTDVARQEQSDNARPAYSGELPDLEGYSERIRRQLACRAWGLRRQEGKPGRRGYVSIS